MRRELIQAITTGAREPVVNSRRRRRRALFRRLRSERARSPTSGLSEKRCRPAAGQKTRASARQPVRSDVAPTCRGRLARGQPQLPEKSTGSPSMRSEGESHRSIASASTDGAFGPVAVVLVGLMGVTTAAVGVRNPEDRQQHLRVTRRMYVVVVRAEEGQLAPGHGSSLPGRLPCGTISTQPRPKRCAALCAS